MDLGSGNESCEIGAQDDYPGGGWPNEHRALMGVGAHVICVSLFYSIGSHYVGYVQGLGLRV
jgi:hypothetical protein